MVSLSPYERASIIVDALSSRTRRSPSLLNPLPIHPSSMKTMVPVKSGKLVSKSCVAAITAKPWGGRVNEGIGSLP